MRGFILYLVIDQFIPFARFGEPSDLQLHKNLPKAFGRQLFPLIRSNLLRCLPGNPIAAQASDVILRESSRSFLARWTCERDGTPCRACFKHDTRSSGDAVGVFAVQRKPDTYYAILLSARRFSFVYVPMCCMTSQCRLITSRTAITSTAPLSDC